MPKQNKAKTAGEGSKPAGKTHAKPPLPPPVIRKVPSLDSKFKGDSKAKVYAGGAFLRAPSPRNLPMPPTRWAGRGSALASAAAVATAATMPPPPSTAASATAAAQHTGLERGTGVRRELQGNLLYLTLGARFPAASYSDLAGKVTGMLLEGLDEDELAEVLADGALRNDYVGEALALLVEETSDERAVRALAAPVAPPPQPPPSGCPPALQVDIGAAHAAAAAEAVATSGLTPALSGIGMRMSPRVSSNKYQTSNILGALPLRVA